MYSSRYRYMAGPVPRPLTSCLGGLRSESSQLDLVPSYAQKGLRHTMPFELCLPSTDGIVQVRVFLGHPLQIAVWLAVLSLGLQGRIASDDEPVLPRAQEPPTTGPSPSRLHDTHTNVVYTYTQRSATSQSHSGCTQDPSKGEYSQHVPPQMNRVVPAQDVRLRRQRRQPALRLRPRLGPSRALDAHVDVRGAAGVVARADGE